MKNYAWIFALGVLGFFHLPAHGKVNLKLVRAIEHLDRTHARLALEANLALPENSQTTEEVTEASFATVAAASNITVAVMLGKMMPQAWPKVANVASATGVILVLAANALYFASVAGNGFGWTDFELIDGSSGGALLIGGGAINVFGSSGGRHYLDIEGGGTWSNLAVWGTLIAGFYLANAGSTAIGNRVKTDKKSAQLHPDAYDLNPRDAVVNLRTERSTHLLGLDKNPLAVAKVKEHVAEITERGSQTSLLLDIAELEDEKGEKLLPESFASRADQLAKAYAEQAPALLENLPKEISLSDRAESSLKLLQTRIGALESYAEENPSALLSKAIQNAKKDERTARMFLGLI